MKFKGPVFPSFKEPPSPRINLSLATPTPPDRALPVGQSWIHHNGQKAILRNLRRMCATTLLSTDQEVLETVRVVKEFLPSEVDRLRFIYVAQVTAESNGISLLTSMNELVAQLLKAKADQMEAMAAQTQEVTEQQ